MSEKADWARRLAVTIEYGVSSRVARNIEELFNGLVAENTQLRDALREARRLADQLRENVGEVQNDLRDEVTKNNQLREALIQARADIDLISETGNVNCDAAFERIDAALAKEVGQPRSAWPAGPGYKIGDTCQSADGTNWRCIGVDVHVLNWGRGEAKEVGQ